jgi:hypothetical protein
MLDMKVREIFGKSCATSGCHGGKSPKLQLSLEAEDLPASLIGIPSRQNDKLVLIDTKDPSQSYLLLKITGGDGMKGRKMPIMKPPLSDEEMKSVVTWIKGFVSKEQAGEAEEEPGGEEETDEEDDG